MDFLKQGVASLAIARPETASSALVWLHPDRAFASYSELTVDTNEVALFFRDGMFCGKLDAGRHTLSPSTIPFLGGLAGPSGIEAEIRFVSKSFPLTVGIMVPDRERHQLTATLRLEINDPVKLMTHLDATEGIEERLRGWVSMKLRDVAPEEIERAPDNGELVGFLVENGLGLGEIGVALSDIDELVLVPPLIPVVAAPVEAPADPSQGVGSAPGGKGASAPVVGARVRAVGGGGQSYSGTVCRVLGDQLEVQWDAGSVTVLPATSVSPESSAAVPATAGASAAHPPLSVGTRVLAVWSDGAFYPATVTSLAGGGIEVAWDNGARAWLAPHQVRS